MERVPEGAPVRIVRIRGLAPRFIRSGSRRKERCRAAACDFRRSAVWGYAAALRASPRRHSSRKRAAICRPPATPQTSPRVSARFGGYAAALQDSIRRHSSRIRAAACRPPAADPARASARGFHKYNRAASFPSQAFATHKSGGMPSSRRAADLSARQRAVSINITALQASARRRSLRIRGWRHAVLPPRRRPRPRVSARFP